jgi:hypothetical protein
MYQGVTHLCAFRRISRAMSRLQIIKIIRASLGRRITELLPPGDGPDLIDDE